jgi:tRNA(adenine34) deaminase
MQIIPENEERDIYFMRLALQEAALAFEKGEVPVGAVLTRDDEVIERGHNMREGAKDPTAHAEVLVLRAGAGDSDSWRLLGTTLYVTKEPCIMCAGAILNARVRRLVYGCRDLKAGGVDSLYTLLNDRRLNHRVEVMSGVLGQECASLLRRFFLERRRQAGDTTYPL